MDAQEASIRDLLDEIFRRVIRFLNARDDERIENGRIEFLEHALLDTSARIESGSMVLAIDAGLCGTLSLFNRNTPRVGLDLMYRVRPRMEAVQLLFDHTMTEVYRVTGSAFPNWIETAVPENPEYRNYVEELLSEMDEVQQPLGPEREQVRRMLYSLADNDQLSGSATETQLVWICLHECAHFLLGHLNPDSGGYSKDLEIEADRCATDLLRKYGDWIVPRIGMTGGAVPSLLLLFAFFEFVRKLVANGIEFSKLESMRSSPESWPETHPAAVARAQAVIRSLGTNFDGADKLWTQVFEEGLHWIEYAVVAGIVDLRYLKRYCRITAQQRMIARYARENKTSIPAISEKFQTEEWDTRDLRQGPMVAEVISGTRMEPLFHGEEDG